MRSGNEIKTDMSEIFFDSIILLFVGYNLRVDGKWKRDKKRNIQNIPRFNYSTVCRLQFAGRWEVEMRQKMKCSKHSSIQSFYCSQVKVWR